MMPYTNIITSFHSYEIKKSTEKYQLVTKLISRKNKIYRVFGDKLQSFVLKRILLKKWEITPQVGGRQSLFVVLLLSSQVYWVQKPFFCFVWLVCFAQSTGNVKKWKKLEIVTKFHMKRRKKVRIWQVW